MRSNRSRFFLIFVTLVLLGVLFGKRSTSRVSDTETATAAPGPATGTAMIVTSGKTLLSGAMDTEAGPHCRKRWERLCGINLELFGQARSSHLLSHPQLVGLGAFNALLSDLDLGNHCAGLPADHRLKRFDQSFLEACNAARNLPAATPRQQKEAAAAGCFFRLQLYQSELLDAATATIPLEKITDKELLRTKFFAAFFGDTRVDMLRSARIAERLLELEPGNEEAAYHALRARYLDASGKDRAHTEDDARALDHALDTLDRVAPGNTMSVEIRLNEARQTGDLGQMEQLIDEMNGRDGGSDLALYYSAWLSDLRGDRSEAKQKLKDLLAKDAMNFRAKLTLGFMEKPENVDGQQLTPFIDGSTLTTPAVAKYF